MSMRNVSRGVAGFILLLLVLPASGLACRCLEDIAPASAYRQADVVVWGQARAVRGDINKEGATASVRVFKAWKKPVRAEIDILTSTTCAFVFRTGEEYLLYLHVSPDGARYTTKRCLGNRTIAEAQKALDWLKRHGVPATVEDIAP